MNQRIKKKKIMIQILQIAKSLEENGIIFCTYPYGKVTKKEQWDIYKYLKNCSGRKSKVLVLPSYLTVNECTIEDLVKMKETIEILITEKDK